MLAWTLNADVLSLSGCLDKNSCMKLWNDREGIFGDKKPSPKRSYIIFDLSKINRIDTAGLATLISLYRLAREAQLDLSFKNASKQFNDLSKVSGVREILPLISE